MVKLRAAAGEQQTHREDHPYDLLWADLVRRGEVVGVWSRKGSAGKRKLVLEEQRPVSETQRARFEKLFAAFPYTAA